MTATTAEEARQEAIEWSHIDEDLSWLEVANKCAYFAELAERFPELADEFRENGII